MCVAGTGFLNGNGFLTEFLSSNGFLTEFLSRNGFLTHQTGGENERNSVQNGSVVFIYRSTSRMIAVSLPLYPYWRESFSLSLSLSLSLGPTHMCTRARAHTHTHS